ncbi:hypothetical protein CYLTODRAFT_456081 [Cylindrobasidium torrendii FP15055 ss-10]|uniref:Uncharacterized protein n=1 Tax=Cylindrobasidium torrendii FP15055 ss-10 TaxID=1314674 RepID=A0A0D7B630_9AGAR|nr:hypothetical protein CYLTODRAFT_456081 [Cylindrobasidium torrendii FP15055 ss-10]
MSLSSEFTTFTTTLDAGRPCEDKYYETRCILEGRKEKPVFNANDEEESVYAFAALFKKTPSDSHDSSSNPSEARDSMQVMTAADQQMKASYVQKWRQNVTETSHWNISVHAPKSPVFPTFSPVASVHPDALQVTSVAPYQTMHCPQSSLPSLELEVSDDEDDLDIFIEDLVARHEDTEDTESDASLHVVIPPRRMSKTEALAAKLKWIPSQIKFKWLATSRKHRTRPTGIVYQ